MFPYGLKYTESEYDIQNIDLLYKIDKECQNTFDLFDLEGFLEIKHFNILFCILYKFHNLYFAHFGMFVVVGFFHFCI